MYIIPKEINSETKIFKCIYLQDLFFILAMLFFTITSSAVVTAKIVWLYYIFAVSITLFLIQKSKHNPEMRNYKSVYLMIIRKRKAYRKIG